MSATDRTSETLPKKPLARRLLRVLLLCLYLVVLVEGGAYITIWALDGAAPTWGAQRVKQEQIALQEVAGGHGNRRVAETRGDLRHPFLGYMSRPSGHAATRTQTSLSGLGLGDPNAHCYNLGPNSVMIALTGGSVAAQLASEGKEILRAQLAATATLAGKDLHFFFFPNAGWKQPQQLIALSYLYSIGIRPDVVINLDGFNEIALYPQSGRRNRVFPAYPRDWYARIAAGTADLEIVGQLEYALRHRVQAARAAHQSSWRISWVRQLMWTLADRKWSKEYGQMRAALESEELGDKRKGADVERTGPPRRFRDSGEMFAELVAIWSRSSRQMQALCLANDAQYFHFLQPNQYLPDSKPLTSQEQRVAYDAHSKYRPSVEAAYPLLALEGARLKAAHGLAFHDLSPIFEGVQETLYEDDCCHLNDRGSELLAEAIVAAIRSSWE